MKFTAANKKQLYSYLKFLFIVFIVLIILVVLYGYNSGSCEVTKSYECSKDFCLYKEFVPELNFALRRDIDTLLQDLSLYKRVTITMYPENILNCAIPNKSGATLSTASVVKGSPMLINYYQNELRSVISRLTNLTLYPTSLDLPTSCCILVYEKENDWINWHYDYNYYNGRFFTVLIPITSELTCTKFQFKKDNEVISLDLTKKGICFEGNYLYHRASKLCDGQKRIILSCQYVTDNSMSYVNQLRIKIKDYAYIGKLF